MKPYYLLLLAVIILPAHATAQSNFKPGYVVTLKGDTLRGSVDYKEWYQNPKSINFKASNGSVSTYSTTDAAGFGINQMEYFERFTMPISMDETEVSHLSTGLDTTTIVNTIFARALATGDNLNLYAYTDRVKTRYIVLNKKTGQLRELSYHTYIDMAGNDRTTVTRNNYRIELKQYAFAFNKFTPKLNERIQNALYNNDIVAVVNIINNVEAHKTLARGHSGLRFFVGAAASSTTLKYHGNIGLAENPQSKAAIFPELNLGVDFFLNPEIGRLIFRAELGVTGGNLNSSSHLIPDTHVMEQNLTQHTVWLSPQVIYNIYNTEATKFFLGAGLRMNFSGYSKNEIHSTDIPTGNIYFSETNFPAAQSVWFQVPVKAGFTFNNKVQIYGQYSFGGLITSADYNGKVAMVGGGISYLFGIKK